MGGGEEKLQDEREHACVREREREQISTSTRFGVLVEISTTEFPSRFNQAKG